MMVGTEEYDIAIHCPIIFKWNEKIKIIDCFKFEIVQNKIFHLYFLFILFIYSYSLFLFIFIIIIFITKYFYLFHRCISQCQ